MSTVSDILNDHINGVLDPLPFENAPGNRPLPYLAPATSETQDSWLGPSQPNTKHRKSVKLFYEPNKVASPNPAATKTRNLSSAPSNPSPQCRPVVNPPQPQEHKIKINIEYYFPLPPPTTSSPTQIINLLDLPKSGRKCIHSSIPSGRPAWPTGTGRHSRWPYLAFLRRTKTTLVSTCRLWTKQRHLGGSA